MTYQRIMVECPYNKGCVCPITSVHKDCIVCGWYPATIEARKSVLRYQAEHNTLFKKEVEKNAR